MRPFHFEKAHFHIHFGARLVVVSLGMLVVSPRKQVVRQVVLVVSLGMLVVRIRITVAC